MRIVLNDAEQGVLDELDYPYEALYRRAIKRHMNPKTGLVMTISWQSIKEDMYLSPRPGIRQENLSKDQLRRMVKQLEKGGLIIVKTNDSKLCIDCVMADKATTQAARVDPLETCANPWLELDDSEKAARVAATEGGGHKKAARVCEYEERLKTRAQLDLFPSELEEATTQAARVEMDNINNINILNNNINNYILSKFDEFWSTYPRRQKKKLAQKIWLKRKLYLFAEKIIADVQWRTANDSQWKNPQFIPLPTTYFNDERWHDERMEVKHASTSNQYTGTRADSIRQMLNTCFEDHEARGYQH